MLRTVAVRSGLVKHLSKTIRYNIVRNLSVECAKKRQNRSILLRENRNLQWHTPSLIRHYSDLPSHTKVALPALSPTMETGTIVSWDKKEGDRLNEGDLLAEIETDKATMGFETPEEGYLAKILIQAGTKDIPVGKLVCIIVENKEDVEKFKDFKDDGTVAKAAPTAPVPEVATPAPSAPAPTPPPVPSTPAAATQPPQSSSTERVYASPMAKRLAEVQNIRLQGKGTGLFGSITSTDLGGQQVGAAGKPADVPSSKAGVAATTPPKPAPGASYVDIPLTGMRTTIAKRLLQSKQTVPHYYLTIDINVEKLLKLRARFNKLYEKDKVKISVNDFIIKAVAVACRRVPEVNSAWMDSFIRQYSNVDVSVAVSTERGLITPIIFGAEVKGVIEISNDIKMLAAKARDNKLQPQEFQGGTVSISNLGMFGVNSFCAIINPPQSCILAVGTTVQRLIHDDDTEKGFKEVPFLNCTLSADHRVVDGAVGANWLKELRKCLEDPETMIL